MDIRYLTDDYAVAPQIGPEHVPLLKAAGFKSVICNRPDTEHGAIAHDNVAEAAREAGLEFRYIPVVSGRIDQKNVDDQAAALAALPRPILAYCRSGGRCTNLFGLVRQQQGG